MKKEQKIWIRKNEELLQFERTFFQRTQNELFFVFRITNQFELDQFIRKLSMIFERDRYVLVALIKSFKEDEFLP